MISLLHDHDTFTSSLYPQPFLPSALDTNLLGMCYLSGLLSCIFVTIAANIEEHSFLNSKACKLPNFFCLKSPANVPLAANPTSMSAGLTWAAASQTFSFAIIAGLFADSNILCFKKLCIKPSSKDTISVEINGNIGASAWNFCRYGCFTVTTEMKSCSFVTSRWPWTADLTLVNKTDTLILLFVSFGVSVTYFIILGHMALSASFLSSIHQCPQNGCINLSDPVRLVYSSLLAGAP